MIYRYRQLHFYNDESGVKYNVSFSHVRFPAAVNPDDPLKKNIPLMRINDRGEVEIGDKYGRRVHSACSRNRSNVYRAIRAIRDYGLSNTWDYMATFTLSQSCLDSITVTDSKTKQKVPLSRSNYDTVMRAISRHIGNLRVKYGDADIKYLLIPELHADQYNYHFHGLLSGVPPDVLTLHWDEKLRSKGYLNWRDFEKKFGRCSLGVIRNTEASVYYCLKYINKDLATHAKNDGTHLYYISKGLNKPTLDFDYSVVTSPYSILESEKTNLSDYGTLYARALSQEEKDEIFHTVFFTDSQQSNLFEERL